MAVDDRIPWPDAAELEAVIAVPEGPGPFPVVTAVHEAFGIDESMRGYPRFLRVREELWALSLEPSHPAPPRRSSGRSGQSQFP